MIEEFLRLIQGSTSRFRCSELSSCQTLLESKFHSIQPYSKSSKEEQLQWERKRVMMWGITTFDYVEGGHFVFSSSGSVFKCSDQLPLGGGDRGVFPEELRTQTKVTRLDPQMCPADPDVIAYVTNGDIWVRSQLYAHWQAAGRRVPRDPIVFLGDPFSSVSHRFLMN